MDFVWEDGHRREAVAALRLGGGNRPAERVACIMCAVTGVAAPLALRPGIEVVLRAMDQTLVRLGGMALAVTVAVAFVLVKTLLAEE
jgi:hypothetical protein